MNYEFHVGDYVETKTGTIGYVSEVPEKGYSSWTAMKLSDCDIDDNRYTVGEPYCIFSFERFSRIGAYDFTKKEKKRIEPISDCNKHIFANAIKSDSQIVRVVSDDILNKINELVDAVNKLMDKEDGE